MGESTDSGGFGRLLTESIPKPHPRVRRLHHYTSFDAVKEILRSHTLNLSHAAFTNDPTELSYGLNMMRHMFVASGKKAFDSCAFLSILYNNTQPYTFSLTESEDMLSQWERYAGRNGCCITFSNETKEMNKLTEGDRVARAPVIYEKEEQQQYLRFLDEQRRKPENKEYRHSTNLYFLLSSVFLKSPAWSHEREWRIVKIIQEESFKDIEYRSGSRFLKPFVSIGCEPLPITQIRVGPADDQDRLVHSIEHLAKMTKGYEHVEVSRSSIRLSPS